MPQGNRRLVWVATFESKNGWNPLREYRGSIWDSQIDGRRSAIRWAGYYAERKGWKFLGVYLLEKIDVTKLKEQELKRHRVPTTILN